MWWSLLWLGQLDWFHNELERKRIYGKSSFLKMVLASASRKEDGCLEVIADYNFIVTKWSDAIGFLMFPDEMIFDSHALGKKVLEIKPFSNTNQVEDVCWYLG